MWFIYAIVNWLGQVKDWFYDAFKTVSGWVWPFNLLATPLQWIYYAFWGLEVAFTAFGEWVTWVGEKISQTVATIDLPQLFRDVVDKAITAWNWVVNAFSNVLGIIEIWWSEAKRFVLVWVDEAKDFAAALFDNLVIALTRLQSAWDNFWTLTWPQWLNSLEGLLANWQNFLVVVFPTLVTWLGVGKLIRTTLVEWFPFYNDLIEIKSTMFEFFANPFDWIRTHVIEPIVDDFSKGFDRGKKGGKD